MWLKTLVSIIYILLIFPLNILFAEEPLKLSSNGESQSVGHDQNMLGVSAYNKKKFNQALKHIRAASVVDRKKGEIFFNIGLTLHQMENHLESAKNFQWALKLSSKNKNISESQIIQQHHWEKNPKIPCNLTKPEKHTLNLSEIVPPEPHISQGGGGGGGY